MANGQQAKVTLTAELASDYGQSFDKAIARAKELQKTLGKLTAAQKAMSRAADRVEKEVKEQGRATEKTTVQTKKYTQATRVAQQNTSGLIGNVVKLAAAYQLVRSAISFFSQSLQLTAEFDRQIATAGAVSQSTAHEVEMLTEAAREMGATTEFTSKQAAEGLVVLGRAGMAANDQISLLPGVIDLATASGTNMAVASDILLNTINQFGKPVSEAAHVMDVLTNATITSKNTLESVGEAMRYLGPTARGLGFSLEESAAVIGIMADNGLLGSLGTRALGTAMTRLTNPTKKMNEVIDKYNIQLFDANNEMKSFGEIVEELEKRLSGLDSKQRNAAISTLFASEAFQEVVILLTNGSKALKDYTKNMEGADGVTKRVAESIRASLGGQLDTLKSAFQAVQESYIRAFGDELPELIGTATEALRGMNEELKDPGVQQAFQNLAKILNSIVKIAGGLARFSLNFGTAAINETAGILGVSPSAPSDVQARLADIADTRNTQRNIQGFIPGASLLPQAQFNPGNIVNITSPVSVNIPSGLSPGGATASSIASAVKFAMSDRNDELVSQVKRSTQL